MGFEVVVNIRGWIVCTRFCWWLYGVCFVVGFERSDWDRIIFKCVIVEVFDIECCSVCGKKNIYYIKIISFFIC